MNTLSEGNGTFAIHLLKMLCQSNPSKNALGLNKEEGIHQGFQLLLRKLNKPDRKYSLRVANRLFADKTCEVLQTFKESSLHFYDSEMEQLSFAEEAEVSRQHINTWVSKQTEGKIPELLSGGSVDSETRLVLINALYFKGKWHQPFNKEYTMDMPFKINKVENNLTFEKLTAWMEADFMKSTDVEVFLPKFKLQEDYDMESLFQRLGVVDVFQEDKADLSGMSPERNLCVSKFVHQSVVEINEEGTEAAAASAIIEFCCASSVPTFCADHPFLFFIRHNKANSILFCGRFSSP